MVQVVDVVLVVARAQEALLAEDYLDVPEEVAAFVLGELALVGEVELIPVPAVSARAG